jgi:RNA polymerase sigma-70 factor (ECF subfamily)
MRVDFRRQIASVVSESMLEQTVQPAELTLTNVEAETASPFDNIADVHAMYEARIFRFLLLSLRDRDVALSLTQDTFLQAWRSRASFRGDCSIATWLMRIAVNLVRDHTRTGGFRFWKRAAATAIDVTDLQSTFAHPVASAESALLARERLAQVWESVERLTARQRTIFLLRFVDELELTEIAVATGLPLPTVKSHLYRALDHVRAGQRESFGKRGKK